MISRGNVPVFSRSATPGAISALGELAHRVADPRLILGRREVHGRGAPPPPGFGADREAPGWPPPPGPRPPRRRRRNRRRRLPRPLPRAPSPEPPALALARSPASAVGRRTAAGPERLPTGVWGPPTRVWGPPTRVWDLPTAVCGPADGRSPPAAGAAAGAGGAPGPPFLAALASPSSAASAAPAAASAAFAPRLGRVDPALLEVAERHDDLGPRRVRPQELDDLSRAEPAAGSPVSVGIRSASKRTIRVHAIFLAEPSGPRSSMTKRSRSWSRACSAYSNPGSASRQSSLQQGEVLLSPFERLFHRDHPVPEHSRLAHGGPLASSPGSRAHPIAQSPAVRKISRAMISRWISLVPS